MGKIAVAHHGAHRAKGLCRVDLCCGVGAFTVQEHGRNKRACCGHAGFVPPDDLAFGGERIDHGEHITLLARTHERAHAGAFLARIADCEGVQLGADRFYDGLNLRIRNHDTADRRTFLACLGCHFAHDFLDEEVELLRAFCGIRAKDRGVEAVLLGDEACRVLRNARVTAQHERGLGRACEADHILGAEAVKEIPHAARNQLESAFGEKPAIKHDFDSEFSDIGGGTRGLHNGGDACEQGWRKFFEHPPDREVEGVDMDTDAAQRRADVLAHETSMARELLQFTINIDMRFGKLAAALGGEDKHRSDATVDVDQVIFLGRACVKAEIIKRLLVLTERHRQRLNHLGALVEVHRAQGRAADLAGVDQHSLCIERTVADAGEGRTCDGAVYAAGGCVGGNPLPHGIACNLFHGALLFGFG